MQRLAVVVGRHAARRYGLLAPLSTHVAVCVQIPASDYPQQRRWKSGSPSSSPTRRHKPATPSRPQYQQHNRDSLVSQLQARAAVDRGYEPDLDFQRQALSLLQAAQSNEELRAALPLCEILERAPEIHGTATAECIRIYEGTGRHRDAIELSLRLLRHDFFLMNTVLTTALQACASLREVDRGFEIFELALERGTLPNRSVFNSMLGLCAMAGDAPTSTRVQQLLHRMETTDTDLNTPSFHHWMTSYARAGHIDLVQQLFDTISDYGLEHTAATYAILMDAYAEQGDYDKTIALLKALKIAKRNDSELKPELIHYNIALKVCGKASQLTQAFNLYEEMKDRKVTPDRVTYITMMHAVFHGDLGVVDTTKVKAAMGGVGAIALASVPFIDFQEHFMTVLFCSSLVGSMGLAVYMNPDGAMRALYPNSDEPHKDTVIEAFFRRLREEDHCGRSMYLWREMIKYNITPDSRVFDVLVRTCVKKRHPELAFEAVFEQANITLVDAENGGVFVLPLATTIALLQSLLAQRRTVMADVVFDAARTHRAFQDMFTETKDAYAYDLRAFHTPQLRSYALRRVLTQLHGESKLFGGARGSSAKLLPQIEFITYHGFDLLDQIDMDDAQIRGLFSMEEMTKETASSRDRGQQPNVHHYFRLRVSRERLAAFFAAPLASATQQRL